MSSRISLRYPRRLIRDDTYDSIRFYATVDLLYTEKIHKTESIVSDLPVRTAQADLKRHFTQTSESPFSRVERQIPFFVLVSRLYFLYLEAFESNKASDRLDYSI